MPSEKDLNCENCGAIEDSDNYAEGTGWVCDNCYAEWEDNVTYMNEFEQGI